MTEPTRVAVVGATGYAGFELARLLLRHPQIPIPTFYLRENSAPGVRCISELYPQLRGVAEAPCRALSVEAIAASGATVAFLSTPHEASVDLAPALLEAGLRVVDLSGAFRFRDPETFARWYKLPEPPRRWTEQAVHDEHRDLLDAVMARNSDQADAALRRLIASTSTMLLTTDPTPPHPT